MEETITDHSSEVDIILKGIDQTDRESVRNACPKLRALYNMVPFLVNQGHVILIFSESTAT